MHARPPWACQNAQAYNNLSNNWPTLGVMVTGMMIASKLLPAYANRARDRSFAFIASTSRLRGGRAVSSDANNRRAAFDTSSTARLNAASLAFEGSVKPLSLRTNWSAEA